MQSETINERLLAEDLAFASYGWDQRIARRISQAASPPVLGIAASLLIADHLATKQAWLWSAVYIVLAVLAPFLFLLWLIHRGRVSDFDIHLREERVQPFLLAVVGAAAAWVVLHVGSAPRLLLVLAAATCILLVLLLGITLRWK